MVGAIESNISTAGGPFDFSRNDVTADVIIYLFNKGLHRLPTKYLVNRTYWYQVKCMNSSQLRRIYTLGTRSRDTGGSHNNSSTAAAVRQQYGSSTAAAAALAAAVTTAVALLRVPQNQKLL